MRYALLSLLLLITPAIAANYYVSAGPTGSDSNAGTNPSIPWATAAKVSGASFAGGDVLNIDASAPIPGCLSFTGAHVTSTPASPFWILPYNGTQWTQTLTQQCSAAVTIDGVSGIHIRYGVLHGNATQTPYGVLVRASGSGSAADTIEISQMDISDFNVAPTANIIASEVFVDGTAGRGLNNVQVTFSALHGLTVTSPDDNGINGHGAGQNITNAYYAFDTVSNIGGRSGILGGSIGNGILINGINIGVAEHNVVHDIGANTTTCGGPAGIWAYNSNAVQIRYNDVRRVQPVPFSSGCDWTAYDLDGYVTNSRIGPGNYSSGNYGAAWLAFPVGTWGTNDISDNISENDAVGANNIQLGVSTFGAYNENTTVTTPVYIHNNTVWNSLPDAAGVHLPVCFTMLGHVPVSPSLFVNNICMMGTDKTGRAEFLSFAGLQPTTMIFDYNIYFSVNGGTFGAYADPACPTESICTSLAAWQAATGFDQHSSTANPLLVAPGTGSSGEMAQHGSPVIGVGVNMQSAYGISPGTQDYFGDAIPNGAGSGYNIGADGAAR
jgi:hypothetical protein